MALEVCAVALGVDHTEIGGKSGRLGKGCEEFLEFGHILAVGEGIILDISVARTGLAACRADIDIVGHSVHDAEALRVDTAPDALGLGHAGSYDTHEIVFLSLDVHHHILSAAGVAVFPHKGTSVFGIFTGDDDARASIGYIKIRKQEEEERKRYFDEFRHIGNCLSDCFLRRHFAVRYSP